MIIYISMVIGKSMQLGPYQWCHWLHSFHIPHKRPYVIIHHTSTVYQLFGSYSQIYTAKRKSAICSRPKNANLCHPLQLLLVCAVHAKLEPWVPNLSFLQQLSVHLQMLPVHTPYTKPKPWVPNLSFSQLLSVQTSTTITQTEFLP